MSGAGSTCAAVVDRCGPVSRVCGHAEHFEQPGMDHAGQPVVGTMPADPLASAPPHLLRFLGIVQAPDDGVGEGLRRLLLRSRSWLGFRLLYRFAMPRADHCFVQSEEMKRDLLRWGILAERMTAVPMGIKKSTFDSVDLTVVPEQPPVVLHLGSLAAVRKLPKTTR